MTNEAFRDEIEEEFDISEYATLDEFFGDIQSHYGKHWQGDIDNLIYAWLDYEFGADIEENSDF